MIETSLITETRQYKEAWLKMLPKLGDYVEEHAQDVLEEENVENFKEIGEGKLTQHGKDIFESGTVIRTELGHGSLKHLVVAWRSYYLVTQ